MNPSHSTPTSTPTHALRAESYSDRARKLAFSYLECSNLEITPIALDRQFSNQQCQTSPACAECTRLQEANIKLKKRLHEQSREMYNMTMTEEVPILKRQIDLLQKQNNTYKKNDYTS